MKTLFTKVMFFSLYFLLQLNMYSQTPVIDGVKDNAWDNANYFVPTKLVKNFLSDDGPTETDLSGKFYTLWDASHFYLLVEVKDDKVYTSADRIHHNDNIEVYFDLDNSKQSSYDGVDDDQIRLLPTMDTTITSKKGVVADDLEFADSMTSDGYVFEIKFPWAVLTRDTFVPSAGMIIGFDLMLTDNDAGSKKDYILAWHAETNDAWQFPSIFGNMKLLASGTTEKYISPDQPAEHDEYPIDENKVSAILYVDKNDPSADDTKDGSETTPFKTIEAALDAASDSAGKGIATKIMIAPGTYREHGLSLTKKGNAYKYMNAEVVIEGEEKGKVIITGSDVWNDGWSVHSGNTYKHDWTYSVSIEKPWGDRGPSEEIATRREMVFVDGIWMKQVMTLDALEDNSFFVDETNDLLYVQVADSIDFNNSDKEIGLRGDGENAPWPPQRLFTVPIDKDKVVLRNLSFQHANMRLSEATLKIQGWKVLVEGCEIVWNNGLGVSISGDNEDVVLRNNTIDHNGGAGLTTWGTRNLTLVNNTTSNNNWRGHLGGYHSHAIGGIKLHHTRKVKVENHVSNNNWCSGLWTDLEVFEIEFTNCEVKNNYGTGVLIEISKDVYLNNCVIERNIPGIRCHSSRNVYIDSCTIKGNAVQFAVYKDHRDFTSNNWTSQFDGRVWDKTPDNWNITNCTIEAVDDPDWQSYADAAMPHWMNYSNPGYQAFWHFSHADYMSTFFGGATIANQNNEWIHPATDTPFKDDEGNDLTTSEWEEWIQGFATGDKAIEEIDNYARTNNADDLTIELLGNAGGENVESANLDFYKTMIEAEDGVPDINTLQAIIDKANAFALVVGMAENDDASALSIDLLVDLGVLFRTDRVDDYKEAIANASPEDLLTIADLQDLLDNAPVINAIKANSTARISMYPNPVAGKLKIETGMDILSVKVYSIAGTVVICHYPKQEGTVINLSAAPKGVYLVQVNTASATITRKIVKQ